MVDIVEDSAEKPRRMFLTARQLAKRWGDASHMFVERRLRKDPDFPRPYQLGAGRLRLFAIDEVEAYEQRSMTRQDKKKEKETVA